MNTPPDIATYGASLHETSPEHKADYTPNIETLSPMQRPNSDLQYTQHYDHEPDAHNYTLPSHPFSNDDLSSYAMGNIDSFDIENISSDAIQNALEQKKPIVINSYIYGSSIYYISDFVENGYVELTSIVKTHNHRLSLMLSE